ncbi:MAG: hypothetical protein ABIE84_01745 [bacterium]
MQPGAIKQPIGNYLAGKKILPAKRFELYQLSSRFSRRLSRACLEAGFYLSPERIHKFTMNYLIQILERRTRLTSDETGSAFCAQLRSQVLNERQDFTEERIIALVRESGFAAGLFDWIAINNAAPVDLAAEGTVLSASGERARAVLYFRAAVARFDAQALSLRDYLTALRALCLHEPTNAEWTERLARQETALTPIAESTPPPDLDSGLWQEIRTIAFGLLADIKYDEWDKYGLAASFVAARLAEPENKDQIKSLLRRKFSGHNSNSPEMRAALDTFLLHMTPEDFAEIIQGLEHGDRNLDLPLVCTLVEKTDYRAAIPLLAIPDYIDKASNLVRQTLLALLCREDLAFLTTLLSSDKSGLVDLAIAGWQKVATADDLPPLRQKLANAQKREAEAIIQILAAIGTHDDVNLLRPCLQKSENVAAAAAEAISRLAEPVDQPLLRQMAADHMFGKVRVEALEALDRLEDPETLSLCRASLQRTDQYSNESSLTKAIIRKLDPPPKKALADPETTFAKLLDQNHGAGAECERAVTEEDILTDRFNLRRLLFVLDQSVVETALNILQKFKPDNCLADLVEAYRHSLRWTASDSRLRRQFTSIIQELAGPEDRPVIEKMISPDEQPEIYNLGCKLVVQVKAWQFIDKVRVLAAQGSVPAKKALLAFVAETRNWAGACQYLTEEDRSVQQETQEALAAAVTIEHLPQLREMIQNNDQNLRRAGLLALQKLLVPPPAETTLQPATEPVPRVNLGRKLALQPTTVEGMKTEIIRLLQEPRVNLTLKLMRLAQDIQLEIPEQVISYLFDLARGYSDDFYLAVCQLAVYANNQEVLEGVWSRAPKDRPNLYFHGSLNHLSSPKDLPAARRTIKQAKSVPNQAVRIIAAHGSWQKDLAGLEKLARDKSKGDVFRRRFVWENIVEFKATQLADERDAAEIERLLTHHNIYYRQAAIIAATRLGLVELLPIIRARLDDNFTLTSSATIQFLRRHGRRDNVFSTIETKLGHSIEGVEEAWLAFVSPEDLPGLRPWTKTGQNSYYALRINAACAAYAKFGYTEALEDIKYWAIKIKSPQTIAALAKLGTTADKASFIQCLEQDKYSSFPAETENAITQLLLAWWEPTDETPYCSAIMDSSSQPMRRVYAKVLAAKSPENACQMARQELEKSLTPSGYVIGGYVIGGRNTNQMLELLGYTGGEADLPIVFSQLTHPHHETRNAAAPAFTQIINRLKGRA